MAVTVFRFKKFFPEFKNTDEFLIEQKLEMAKARLDETVWGDREDEGVLYLTAHFLSLSPAGEQARLKKENRSNMYLDEFDRLKKAAVFAVGRVC